MECREHKRRENRQNLFSFGNLKKEHSNSHLPPYHQVKARVQTEPQAKYAHRYCREPLAPKNANAIFNTHEQRTPSFNFDVLEAGLERPLLTEQDGKANRRMIPAQQTRGYSPCQSGSSSYFYDPSIEDISRKYGIRMNNLKSARRESIGKNNMETYTIQPKRQYSQAKLQTKKIQQRPIFYEESFQNATQHFDRFKLRNQNSKKGFYYPNPQLPSFEGHEVRPQPPFEPYPTFYEPSCNEITNPQDTIDSIYELNQKINEKVNRILNDEYIYY